MSRYADWRQEQTQNDPTAFDGIRAMQRRIREKEQAKREPIDLDALVVAVLDGAVGDQPMSDLETREGACAAVEAVVAAKIGRPLTVHEQGNVGMSTIIEFNRRLQAKRDGLRETQIALNNPMFGIGR